jgi:hypothetical protein
LPSSASSRCRAASLPFLRRPRAKRLTPPDSTIAPNVALEYLSASNTRQAICSQVANTLTFDGSSHAFSRAQLSCRTATSRWLGEWKPSREAAPWKPRAALGPQEKWKGLSVHQATTMCLPRERLLAHISHRYYEIDRHTDTEQTQIFSDRNSRFRYPFYSPMLGTENCKHFI